MSWISRKIFAWGGRKDASPSPAEGNAPGAGGAGGDAAAGSSDEVDLGLIGEIISRHGGDNTALIPILQDIQRHYRYLPEAALRHLAETSGISAAEIAGVSTFYSQFRHRPVGRHLVRVCHGTACHVAGAPLITDALRRHVGIESPDEDTDAARRFTIEKVPCLGCCSLAPCMTVDGVTYGRLTPHQACSVLDEVERNGQA